MNLTLVNVYVCTVVGVILTLFEIPCYQTGIMLVMLRFAMFIHHFGKLFIWLAPFLVDNIIVLGICTVTWGYVCIQNSIRTDVEQPCILSNIVNKMCGQDENEMLRDILYHAGQKKDLQKFSVAFNIASYILLVLLVLKLVYLWRLKK